MAAIALDDATVVTGGITALEGADLDIADGEFVAVIGPSGSGKTSLLRAIAGLATVPRGRVLIDGRDATGIAPGDRDVAMVFQQSALLPRRSVRRNISFPLELRHRSVAEIRQRVDAEVRALHIEALLERDPAHLAEGEAQLVQIARSMVRVPRVLLLDEPFAHLDEHVRAALRAEIGMLQRGYGVTTVMATNDGVDAMTLADRVVVLDRGRVIQFATPDVVRRSPASLAAAVAAGDVSCFPAELVSDADGDRIVRRGASGVVVFRHPVSSHETIGGSRAVVVAVRPNDVRLDPNGPIDAVVERHVPGPGRSVSCEFAGVRVEVAARPPLPDVGSRVRLRIHRVLVVDATTELAVAR
jgi:multiple sugar transport system ATP-binding protein